MPVSVLFLLSRWTRITHGNIVRSWNRISHRSYVPLLGVAIINLLLILLPIMVLCFLLTIILDLPWRAARVLLTLFTVMGLIKKLHSLFNFSQTFVKIVLAVPSNILVYFSLKDVC